MTRHKAIIFSLVLWFSKSGCQGTEALLADRLQSIKFSENVTVENRQDVIENILEKLKTAKLLNKNTGDVEAAVKFGIAWCDIPVTSSPPRSVLLRAPTIMETFEAAARMHGLRVHNVGNGIVILPSSILLPKRDDILRVETRYTQMMLNFPFKVLLVHVPKKEVAPVVDMLNQRLQLDSGMGMFQKPVTIDNHVINPDRRSRAPIPEVLLNIKGSWSYCDFLYAYALLGGFRFTEVAPQKLVVELEKSDKGTPPRP